VELIEIEVIGLEQTKRLLEILARVFFQAAVGLAGKEAVLAIGRERGAETFLCVAIAGRDVEVIDAVVDGFGDDVVAWSLAEDATAAVMAAFWRNSRRSMICLPRSGISVLPFGCESIYPRLPLLAIFLALVTSIE
jgi:hypothetical protein